MRGFLLAGVTSSIALASPSVAAPRFADALQKHLDAVSARDLPALESTLTSGADLELYLPTGKRSTTRKEFVDFHRTWFAEKGWTMRFTPISSHVGRDLAVATVRTRYEDQVDGKPYWSENWLTLTFGLEPDGWRLVHDQNTRIRTSADPAP